MTRGGRQQLWLFARFALALAALELLGFWAATREAIEPRPWQIADRPGDPAREWRHVRQVQPAAARQVQ